MIAVAAALALLPAACGKKDDSTPKSAGTGHARGSSPSAYLGKQRTPAVILAAGDIASCDSDDDAATAQLIARTPGTVLALGDDAYESGSADEFSHCYRPTWGRFKKRTQPTPGNHEYDTDGAAGYFGYFGTAAGPPGKGYYSFDLGGWHIVSLNSNCSDIGGCDAGSPQERWLRADLAAHPARCTLAYWHHPYFTSGTEHGREEEMGPIWQELYERGGDIVLSAHEHNYERFAPQTPTGKPDPRRGMVNFVVGTGGKSHYQDLGEPIDNSEARNDQTFGVLELRLHRNGYRWRFLATGDQQFSDAGSASCHD